MNPTMLPRVLGSLFQAITAIQTMFMSVWSQFGAVSLLLSLVIILILVRRFYKSHGQSDSARKSHNTEDK